ncbi:hypothetical protein [Tahibacter amnicola]|uniref:Secreted protein n=1 Tax=Tahibacter amnicola TaxID=2976241 RepID=A0ABY6BJ17_9GAMM|nr:hypothetical protein [Tahibacter amnicola]UXI68365.1 hypothetical protein N4264_01555 [Tahibacter amnicola]
MSSRAIALAFALFPLASAAITTTFGDEKAITLSGFSYRAGVVRATVSQGFLLCANTAWWVNSPTPNTTGLAVQHVDPATSTARFFFGDQRLNTLPLVPNDLRSMTGSGPDTKLSGVNGSGTGTLACYAVDATGRRIGAYAGLFADTFEPAPARQCPRVPAAGPCLTVRVASIEPSNGVYLYTYFIDYQLPAAVGRYVIRDGFDPRLFSETTEWCAGMVGSNDCVGLSGTSHTVDYLAFGSSGEPQLGRVIVRRFTRLGVGPADLAASASPPVIAALFPEASILQAERQIDDNVAVGRGLVSAPDALDPAMDSAE